MDHAGRLFSLYLVANYSRAECAMFLAKVPLGAQYILVSRFCYSLAVIAGPKHIFCIPVRSAVPMLTRI